MRMALENLDQPWQPANHLSAVRAAANLIQMQQASHDLRWLNKAREAFASPASLA
jgi:hypothetical protein